MFVLTFISVADQRRKAKLRFTPLGLANPDRQQTGASHFHLPARCQSQAGYFPLAHNPIVSGHSSICLPNIQRI